MFKLMGAVLIVISATLWGFSKEERLKRRIEIISDLISGLLLLENEISYGKRDIKNALWSIGEINNVKLFKSAAEYMDKLGVKMGFKRATEENGKFLLGTEKQALDTLAENLGMTGTDTQIKSIKHARILLIEAKERASAEYERSGKLYKGAGFLGGVAVVIFLL